ncbi:unnamed protein product [Protopolystoma xenopodis]|uniref:DREV methyltransferase n=1 Tax=Protopolystoma xenopodis TaxID=117903 RepID=A0A448XCN4_9PLAT|nr:unnamed protein product [Protopolystoma xenopodis]
MEISYEVSILFCDVCTRVVDVNSWHVPASILKDEPHVNSTGTGRHQLGPPYDVISCLNLLDRCDRPITLLRQIHSSLTPETGILLLAIVLPLNQYVETAPDRHPSETLDISGSKIWEVQLNSLVINVLQPAGFELIRFTRLPYLCEGDFSRAFYSLNDVILVLRPVHV